MTIRAAVLREPGDVRVEDVELDPPQAGEVLVRVAAAGVCHSDLHLVNGALGDGRWPMVLGHEGAGVVEALGEDVTILRWAIRSRSASSPRAGPARRASPAGGISASGQRRRASAGRFSTARRGCGRPTGRHSSTA